MSHDIRTPLTALRGALGLLDRKDVSPEMTHQMVEMLRRTSNRFERLALGLVAVDLIDEGSMPVLREVCDLRYLAADAINALKREHGLIEVDLPDEPVEVACDRDRTMQALDHVLDNARKFGGPDGTVSVAVRSDGTHGIVAITDEGPGVPAEERERIFQRYVQVGERLPNEPRGAGIGLYLARWSAEVMGGSVSLTDGGPKPTFELRLPALGAVVDQLPVDMVGP
jgi:signal transduction histidine kinase